MVDVDIEQYLNRLVNESLLSLMDFQTPISALWAELSSDLEEELGRSLASDERSCLRNHLVCLVVDEIDRHLMELDGYRLLDLSIDDAGQTIKVYEPNKISAAIEMPLYEFVRILLTEDFKSLDALLESCS